MTDGAGWGGQLHLGREKQVSAVTAGEIAAAALDTFTPRLITPVTLITATCYYYYAVAS